MFPEIIQKIISSSNEESKPIDECRVNMPANSDMIQVTHWLEVSGRVGALIEKEKKQIFEEVRSHIPACINIQTIPVKTGKQSVMCVCLTLQMDAKHNKIDDIVRLCKFADVANTAIVHKYQTDMLLDNLYDDMKPLMKLHEEVHLTIHKSVGGSASCTFNSVETRTVCYH